MAFQRKRRRRRGRLTGVDEEMTAVLRRLGTGNREIHPEIWSRWHHIVGPDLAKRTMPRRLQGRTLILAVTSSAWMHELSYLRGTIVERIAEAVGPNIVREIRLTLDTTLPVRPTIPPPLPPEPVSDAPLPGAVASAAERVADPQLREAVLRAARANIKF